MMKKAFYLPFLMLFLCLGCSSDTKTQEPEIPVSEVYKVPEALSAYYSEVDFSKKGESLKEDLAVLTIAKHSVFLEYWQRHNYLYDADEDPNNPQNVILIYNGESRNEREHWSSSNEYEPQTFNTEHIYPRSYLTSNAMADLHNLRTADANINESRSNFPYTNGKGEYKLVNYNSFFPGDEWRGDVARMIMYMNLRYDESFKNMGGLELFLEWNAEDPVSFLENQRNEIIYKAQGNRNPFIDNPNLATRIWGGKTAENLWNGEPTEEPTSETIFFSEYIEGSEFNKALEIVNLSGEEVDLSSYSIKKQGNGEGKWGEGYNLSGTLSSNEVLVLINSRAELDKLINEADISLNSSPLDFNGNDPLGLFKNNKLVDMIGSPGGENFAKDVSLRRKKEVTVPNPTFDPEEWSVFEENTVEDIGEY
ncbi:MAG TPA: endonuclease [Salinimicrobium sp.]|nr:endonuclease [Salinimicrobium sp.]